MHSVEFCALTIGLASLQSIDSIFCAIEMVDLMNNKSLAGNFSYFIEIIL